MRFRPNELLQCGMWHVDCISEASFWSSCVRVSKKGFAIPEPNKPRSVWRASAINRAAAVVHAGRAAHARVLRVLRQARTQPCIHVHASSARRHRRPARHAADGEPAVRRDARRGAAHQRGGRGGRRRRRRARGPLPAPDRRRLQLLRRPLRLVGRIRGVAAEPQRHALTLTPTLTLALSLSLSLGLDLSPSLTSKARWEFALALALALVPTLVLATKATSVGSASCHMPTAWLQNPHPHPYPAPHPDPRPAPHPDWPWP
eukprot:scaffold75298_cov50-Phaeocystis_antarctica.AAC.2